MSRRIIVFCAFALASAGLFIRLGFWQLDRLHETQAQNALLAEEQRITSAPLPPHAGTAVQRFRAASVNGRYDYEHELILSNRTRRGSPGVELITPVRVAGGDSAVLVNRGWVYSPDGGSVDRTRWHEGDSAHVTGYVEVISPDPGATRSSIDPGIVRRVNRGEVASKIPYPVASAYLVVTGDTADLAHPARRDPPAPDEGSHRSYAFQWFSFAAIALIGAGIVVRREVASRGTADAPAELAR